MFLRYTGVLAFACFGLLSLSGAYKITPYVMDGVPGFLNVTTSPFVKIGDGYYYIETKMEKNWYDAYESCRRMGADLISFDSIEKWKLINQYLINTNIQARYYTSGTDLHLEGKHVWFANGQPIALDIWYANNPNNDGNIEHCDELGYKEENRSETPGLNDVRCDFPLRYICEAPKPKTASFIVW
ncbi:C-type lectin 37Da-like isoform X1 [Drosophila pseudoobscura]|uniref:C-type lectin 37Da-like isoform X1 n=1 Tax=Drosophila pseudoobscura pseudoobscura TaxID=46245 RepID=A0A6I8W113_DROPS|nr:C-type lectin 37Da-like isoform X1 [Drosophila pseudoobscura]